MTGAGADDAHGKRGCDRIRSQLPPKKDAAMRSLQGHFLIAMPGMGDPNFHETVAYICKHDDDGAFGIVINRPTTMVVDDVFRQLSLGVRPGPHSAEPVLSGGPVQPDRGFVLHQSHTAFDSTLDPDAPVKVTVSQDILAAMARGDGPAPAVVALGYAGWAAGQLESEMATNAWLSAPADPSIIFATPYEQRWTAAARLLGVDIHQIASYAGHA
jgi:putative transcriptional regulator